MPSRTILDADPALQEAWPQLLRWVSTKHPGYRLKIRETHVPPEEQRERFHQGRNGLDEVVNSNDIVTYEDGFERLTPQNYYPSRAVKFSVVNEMGYDVWDQGVLMGIALACQAFKLGFESPNFIYVTRSSK